jgi:hypothetical protein
MRRLHGLRKSTAVVVVLAFCFVSVFIAPLHAAMVGTADILQKQSNDLQRQKVLQFMERQEVAQQLQAWGVEPAEAKARVATMTDEEISRIAGKIDQLPAGGDAVTFVILLAVIAFIVLIITDILGVTDVFTFIKKR